MHALSECYIHDKIMWQLFFYMYIISRLFPRLNIRCFSCSLAELFLAPCAPLLSLESKPVPAADSTSRLPSDFLLGWITTSVVLFTHPEGVTGGCIGCNVVMCACYFAEKSLCTSSFCCVSVSYLLCVYHAQFDSLNMDM